MLCYPPLFLGYVQGMSDILSPILVVMENEVDAFWCFAGAMERVVSVLHVFLFNLTLNLDKFKMNKESVCKSTELTKPFMNFF